MSITHEYVRQVPYDDSETVLDRVRSIDQGSANTALVEVVMLAPSHRIVVDWAAVVRFKGADGRDDPVTLGENVRRLLLSDRMQRFWNPPAPVCCERPVDHKAYAQKKQQEKNKRKGTGYRAPQNYGLFCMLQQLVTLRQTPGLRYGAAAEAILLEHGLDPCDGRLLQPGYEWIPRDGRQKSRLEQYHDDERKAKTLIFGPEVMRENGDGDVADWTESLHPVGKRGEWLKDKTKPMEDICDAYLQAHRLLIDRHEARELEARKVAREDKKLQREYEEATKAEKKRKRTDDDTRPPPAKRARAAVVIDLAD